MKQIHQNRGKMGLFDFGKKEKNKEVSKKEQSKQTEESFDISEGGLIFEARIQILTKSKDYAKEVAKKYVEAINKAIDQKRRRKYFVLKHQVSIPKKLSKKEKEEDAQEQGDVFRIDLEFEIGVKIKTNIFDFCFEYMPFFIEISEPMNISFSSHDLTDYLTTIQATIHKIDESLKQNILVNGQLKEKNEMLSKSMIRLLRNIILISLKQKNKNAKEISKETGVPEDQLKLFIDNMIKDKEIKLIKNKYSIVK